MLTVFIALAVGFGLTVGLYVGQKIKLGTAIGLGFLAMILVMGIGSIKVIDAGEAGVKVVFGNVSSEPLYNGMHLVEPWADVYIYESRLIPLHMNASNNSGITAPSSDNLEMVLDLTEKYQVNVDLLPWIHEHLGPDYEQRILIPLTRETVRNSVPNFTAMEAYSTKKEQLKEIIFEKTKSALLDEVGVETTNAQGEKEVEVAIELVNINLRNVSAPLKIKEAISEKLEKQQEEEQKEFELNIERKDAEIKIVEAEGLAESQRIINESLTPAYLQHEAIEAYKDLANSNNTTFIIMPTSTEGAGLPLILQSNRGENINQSSDQAAGQSQSQ